MMSSRFRLVMPRKNHQASGFTLIELLVVVIVLGVLSAIISRFFIGHLYFTRRLETASRVDTNISRLNALFANEASEAESFVQGQALSGCDDSGNSLLALQVPKPSGNYGDPDNISTIFYYNNSGDIKRCGPSVNPNGSLDHDAGNQTGVLMRDAALVIEGGTTAKQLVYGIDVAGYTGSPELTTGQIVRAKTVFICNPLPAGLTAAEISARQERGDC